MIFAIVKLLAFVETDYLLLSRTISLGWSIREWESPEGFAMLVSIFFGHDVDNIGRVFGLMTS